MKMKLCVLMLFLSVSANLFCQTKDKNIKFIASYAMSNALQVPSVNDVELYPEPTWMLGGIDLKMLLDTKLRHTQFMIGSTYLSGQNEPNESSTYGGGFYVGPYISSGGKWIQFSAYLGVGVFSFHDDILQWDSNQKLLLYSKESNFTALGSKSGCGLVFNIKNVSLNIGYQIFATASEKSAIVQHGFEAGLGIRL